MPRQQGDLNGPDDEPLEPWAGCLVYFAGFVLCVFWLIVAACVLRACA